MKILYVTTISLTINSFFKPHIEMLINDGNLVDIACNCEGLPLDNLYKELGCNSFQVDFSRNPLSFNNIKAYKQLRTVIEQGKYDIVHCHTPNASVICRLVCKKNKNLKVFYTAHGFHFYKGAPKLNWMIYYPIEKFCSKYTDKLITINKEDYDLAQNKLLAKEVYYVPGVGIDLSRFDNIQVNRNEKRQEIGISKESLFLFSVGELNENKNHQIVIRALAKINNKNIHYVIAGEGNKKEFLINLSKELGVSEQVHLIGYRNDILELNYSADVFCFPSIREGLSVSLMEAMACGLPCLVSKIRGNVDLIDENGGKVFNALNEKECESALRYIIENNFLDLGKYNSEKVKKFSLNFVLEKMRSLYLR